MDTSTVYAVVSLAVALLVCLLFFSQRIGSLLRGECWKCLGKGYLIIHIEGYQSVKRECPRCLGTGEHHVG